MAARFAWVGELAAKHGHAALRLLSGDLILENIQCSTSTPSAMRTTSAAIQFRGRHLARPLLRRGTAAALLLATMKDGHRQSSHCHAVS